MKSRSVLLGGMFSLLLTACGSSPLIPNETIRLTAQTSVSLGTLATGAAILGVIHMVYDPLAPNWEIEETRVTDDTYRFSMTMKRYHTGGAGEALQILKRRAVQLQAQQGFGQYVITEYSEGIDSRTLGARRVAEGMIRLAPRQEADSFSLNGVN